MIVRWRPMQPRDVPACADIVASHPVTGARYGPAIASLRKAWLRILGSDAAIMAVFEETEGLRSTICGSGVAVFVQDDFIRELKAQPFWIGPELARRIVRGDSPLLSDSQLREANSRGGLNVVTWEGSLRPEFEQISELRRMLVSSFVENLRGFFLKEAIANQTGTEERAQWVLRTGGFLWDPAARRYVDRLEGDPKEILKRPYVLGVSREVECRQPGSWIGAIFEYSPPRIGFSRAEQRLLIAALDGATDQELSSTLGISLPTVKTTWSSIHNRTASSLPDLFPSNAQADAETPERGKEKRRRLLAYVREHPEELRPVSRRLLQQAAGPGIPSREPA